MYTFKWIFVFKKNCVYALFSRALAFAIYWYSAHAFFEHTQKNLAEDLWIKFYKCNAMRVCVCVWIGYILLSVRNQKKKKLLYLCHISFIQLRVFEFAQKGLCTKIVYTFRRTYIYRIFSDIPTQTHTDREKRCAKRVVVAEYITTLICHNENKWPPLLDK